MAPKSIIKSEHAEAIIELYKLGYGCERIKTRLNLPYSIGCIRSLLKKSAFITVKLTNKKAITADIKPLVLSDYAEGMPKTEICMKFAIGYNTLTRFLKSNKISLPTLNEHGYSVSKKYPNYKVISRGSRSGFYHYQCPKGHDFSMWGVNFIKSGKCPSCMHSTSKVQEQIFDWLSTEGFSPEINFSIKTGSNRSPELDVYIADKKVGVEYHGIYFHSDQFKDPNYHFKKYEFFHNHDIKTLQFFSNEWEEKETIVKSIILAKLGKFQHKIGARQGSIVTSLSKQDSKIFFKENHLQGGTPALKTVAIKYMDTIVAALSIRKNKNSVEIARFACKQGWLIPGAFQRLLTHVLVHAKQIYRVEKVITYADLRISDGNVYKKAGFSLVRRTKLDWFWEKSGKRYNRTLSWGKSEKAFRAEGFNKVYGTGHLKFERVL